VRGLGRTLVAVLLAVAAAGCALYPQTRGATALGRADRLAREGALEDAVTAYGEYLTQHPETEAAPRATASRETLRALLGARAEMTRLRDELARLREDLARRDSDLIRVRQEAERLKTDLERLKQIDLKLERRRAQ
jgi:chromosome segregation ATPase